MRRVLGKMVMTAGRVVPGCLGQSFEVNSRSIELGGVHLYGASVFSGYSTSAYPLSGFGQVPSQGLAALGGFESLSGWQASAGVSENLSAHTALTAQYVYLNSARQLPGKSNQYGRSQCPGFPGLEPRGCSTLAMPNDHVSNF
jgi:hypothetical protein